MSDRKPPAKTGDPACAARATCRADAARRWGTGFRLLRARVDRFLPRGFTLFASRLKPVLQPRRSRPLADLLCALAMVGLALATAGMTPAAPTRKTYRPRGSRAEKLLSCSAQHGAPKGAWNYSIVFPHAIANGGGIAMTSWMLPESRDVRLCSRPCRRTPNSVDGRGGPSHKLLDFNRLRASALSHLTLRFPSGGLMLVPRISTPATRRWKASRHCSTREPRPPGRSRGPPASAAKRRGPD